MDPIKTKLEELSKRLDNQKENLEDLEEFKKILDEAKVLSEQEKKRFGREDKIYSFKNKTVRELLDSKDSDYIEEFIVGKLIDPDGTIQSLMYDNKDDIYNSGWIDKEIKFIGVVDKSVSIVVL